MNSDENLPQVFKLNTGRKIPAVGLGTFQSGAGNEQVRAIVREALKLGYRHIDTAGDYGTEVEVGNAVRDSCIPRDEIFITTKLPNHWHEPGNVEEALEQSLDRLQLTYVDLYLMHFPYAYAASQNHDKLRHPDGKPVIDLDLSRRYPDVWKAMEARVNTGKARAIGLSNFNILKTKRILASARIRPAVNQVEIHPYLAQADLLAFCQKEGIHVTAHQPLGGRPIAAVSPKAGSPGPLQDSTIARVAAECSKSVAQAMLSWNVMRGVSVIPKTANAGRLPENLGVFSLGKAHFQEIDSLSTKVGETRFLDPREYIGFNIFDETEDQPVENR